MRPLARIPLNRDSNCLVGRKMPHDIDDVASILGTELDAKLTPDFSVTQPGDFPGWSEIGELHGDILLGWKLYGGAHFLCGNHQTVARGFLNLSIWHIKIVRLHLRLGFGYNKHNQTQHRDEAHFRPL